MIRRYYWGLAIGHTYAHTWQSSSPNTLSAPGPNHNDQTFDVAGLQELINNTGNELEYSLENLENECLQADEEHSDDDDLATGGGDVELSAYQEMYGWKWL